MDNMPKGRIITFYSYKGGSSRSMSVANIAWILASSGRRVWRWIGIWEHRVFTGILRRFCLIGS